MKITACVLFLMTLPISARLQQKDQKAQLRNEKNWLKIYCIRTEKDGIIFRIENHNNTSYYIPENYWAQTLSASDTLYNESVFKKRYSEITRYYYHQFGRTIISQEVIDGLVPDSSEVKSSVFHYNQFVPPKLIEIKPHAFIIKKEPLKSPLNVQYVSFRIYKESYSPKCENTPYLRTVYRLRSKTIVYGYGKDISSGVSHPIMATAMCFLPIKQRNDELDIMAKPLFRGLLFIIFYFANSWICLLVRKASMKVLTRCLSSRWSGFAILDQILVDL
ncbi:MAG: hypothetical protein ACTHMI_09470 [Mucilaginibacter sp.]